MVEYLNLQKKNSPKSKIYFCSSIICFFTCFLNTIHAQRPADFGKGIKNLSDQETKDVKDGPDSTVYEFVLTNNIYEKYIVDDSLADLRFLHSKLRQSDGSEQINTGNFGSASMSLIYRPEINSGFNIGLRQYNVYKTTLENFRFFEQNRPISDVYFSQLGNQENINVQANFSRNFSDGLSVSLNYNRISQKGFYNGQDTKSTSFGFGLRYKNTGNNYNAFLIFLNNANEEGHIGGIIDEENLKEEFKKDIPVILKEATTREQERSIAFIQYYHLNSNSNKTWRLYLKNDFKYMPSYYKFSDVSINDNNDSIFYHELPVENRGIRRYVSANQLSNGFYVNGEKINGIKGRLGIIIDYFNISNLPVKIIRSDITATFEGQIPITKKLLLETGAKLGLLKNIGNFDVTGNVNIGISKIATLSGKVRLFRSEPSYNSLHLVMNENIVIDTTFSKPLGTIFQADVNIPALKFSAGISQSLITNPIYWDIESNPSQKNGIFTATYLRVKQNLRLGHFHLDNQVHIQILNEKLYPVPPIYSTHQLYYSGKWFKKEMDVNIGLDIRLISDYNGPAYHPLYGEFHQSNIVLPFFPAANLYFLARISSFRALIVMENFGQYFRNETNFDVVNNPQFDPKLRFGIQWLLKD